MQGIGSSGSGFLCRSVIVEIVMNKALLIGEIMCGVLLVLILWFGLRDRERKETPPDENDYQRMVHRAGELAIRFGDGKLGLEEHCEYQELCSRIGKYRADHETR